MSGTPDDTKESFRLHDENAWREGYRAKQAAGVKFEIKSFNEWVPPNKHFDFSGKKEDYREVQEAPIEAVFDLGKIAISLNATPTIHHIPERKLWLAQREAGTNEVWLFKDVGDWEDIPVGVEPRWLPYCKYRPKPKTVKYYFALYKMPSGDINTIRGLCKEWICDWTSRCGNTIIGNIEEREIEIE